MILLAPAKINLFFQVLGKREDGYHEIASLYQAIDLFDRLFFSPSSQDLLTSTDPTLPLDESNLIIKALHLFRKSHPVPPLHIHLEKNIPIEAGLGGGSSNAATTLKALNQIAGFPLPSEKLLEIAALLGSDVPFFFSNGCAYCTGRGEKFTQTSLPTPLSGWIVKPDFGLSTPLVYKALKPEDYSIKKNEILFPLFFNDLEKGAFRLSPKLKEMKQELEQDFKTVVMTGSGSAFFCLQGSPKKRIGMSYFPFKTWP